MVKLYKANKTTLKVNGSKTEFTFLTNEGEKIIKTDESIERIKSRMKDVINGERDKVYLTDGMSNVDISLLENGKWQLFDEWDIYEFDFVN